MGLLPQNPSTKQLGPRGSSGYSSMISHCVRACSNSTMVILSAWRSLSACLENAYFPARTNLRIVWLSTSQESARRSGGGGGSRTPVRKGPGLKAYIRSRFETASQPLTSSQQELTAASPMGLAPPPRTEEEKPARIHDAAFTPASEGEATRYLFN